jgi:hypothetical protein
MLHLAVGSQILPLLHAARSQILPLNNTAGGQILLLLDAAVKSYCCFMQQGVNLAAGIHV